MITSLCPTSASDKELCLDLLHDGSTLHRQGTRKEGEPQTNGKMRTDRRIVFYLTMTLLGERMARCRCPFFYDSEPFRALTSSR